jgi:endonuclease-3
LQIVEGKLQIGFDSLSRLASLLESLRAFYGTLPPPPRDPFTLFVWEVLSVHSTAHKRDAALAALKRARALTPDAMSRVPQKSLTEAVLLAGPYQPQRLQALKTGVDIFRRKPDLPATIKGPLAAARRALKGLPQMGEGGAYRMLLFAGDHPILPVDARVARVARRLGYGVDQGGFAKLAKSVREALTNELSSEAETFRHASIYLEHHGAVTCTQSDPHCHVCPIVAECPEGQKRSAPGLSPKP